ncbi:hypothetical protein Vafri_18453 [Volvox africanus]|uniref:Uncharacterized protein n=1 Tax=Volvox africanus TaxID=51714 RepID=A0A8J4F8P0_9CHLO|nr:hypothetical protein Vafri_18453 [Volvox africanus]
MLARQQLHLIAHLQCFRADRAHLIPAESRTESGRFFSQASESLEICENPGRLLSGLAVVSTNLFMNQTKRFHSPGFRQCGTAASRSSLIMTTVVATTMDSITPNPLACDVRLQTLTFQVGHPTPLHPPRCAAKMQPPCETREAWRAAARCELAAPQALHPAPAL